MRVIGLAGWSGAGKTTLIASLIPELTAPRPHGLDDQARPSRLRRRSARQGLLRPPEAGAKEVLVSSSQRFALMHELRGEPEPPLDDAAAATRLRSTSSSSRASSASAHPKLEVYRSETEQGLHPPEATATSQRSRRTPRARSRSRVSRSDDVAAIADWMLANAPRDRQAGSSLKPAARSLGAETAAAKECSLPWPRARPDTSRTRSGPCLRPAQGSRSTRHGRVTTMTRGAALRPRCPVRSAAAACRSYACGFPCRLHGLARRLAWQRDRRAVFFGCRSRRRRCRPRRPGLRVALIRQRRKVALALERLRPARPARREPLTAREWSDGRPHSRRSRAPSPNGAARAPPACPR